MKIWKKDTGVKFSNSSACFGYEYNPGSGKIDIATISIRDRFPEKGWGMLEESHEMAVVIKGSGYILFKDGEKYDLEVGGVVYIEPGEWFCWGGNMDMVVPCGPAFNPDKHRLSED
ncbi:hypothetical protein KA068_00475 [Candidatus Saccharibacteria bacterium]|jgi:hypothetical protein|nr:hypothetical protein [Candidatus Saccharibacteria bacterium]